MTLIIYLLAAIVVLGVFFLLLSSAAAVYLKFRGTRLVTCPETKEPAAVEVDAKYAAITAPTGERGLRLKDCSRWPESQDCGQQCLGQIVSAPEDCLVRNILTKWYEGRTCVFCGKALGEIDWLDHKPALMSPERVTREWNEIPAEKVPVVLQTHMPVCWDCHVAETFRRRYPERFVDRPWKLRESHRSS
jgi:hypothetical protein